MKYLFFVLFLFLPSRGLSQKYNQSDTLYIKYNSLIFIHPSKVEIDSLVKVDTTANFKDAISDYTYYSSKLIGFIRSNKIPYEESEAKNYVLTSKGKKTCILKRKELHEVFAYIFVDAKGNYKIEKGVKTDADLISIVKNFIMKKQ